MPKQQNRNQMFVKSFNDFMVSMCDIYYSDLKEWKLEPTAENKNQAIHKYTFTIPKKIVLCEVDTPYMDENGEKQQAGQIMQDQEIPNVRVFETHFGDYFHPYEMERFHTSVSYTSLYYPSINDKGDLVSDIIVCYFKSYIPYPCGIMTRDQLQERCRQLERMNNELKYDLDDFANIVHTQNRKIGRLKREVKHKEAIFNDRINNAVYRMQERIREMYEKLGKEAEEECPVCYEVMKTNELMVPGCCHYICASCNEKCDKCPICREEYIA
jgi:hypothetical protein